MGDKLPPKLCNPDGQILGCRVVQSSNVIEYSVIKNTLDRRTLTGDVRKIQSSSKAIGIDITINGEHNPIGVSVHPSTLVLLWDVGKEMCCIEFKPLGKLHVFFFTASQNPQAWSPEAHHVLVLSGQCPIWVVTQELQAPFQAGWVFHTIH